MPKKNEAYDDTVSDAEEAELEKLMQSNEVPEPDEQDGASTDDDAGDPPDGDDGDDGADDGKPEPKDDGADDDDGDDGGADDGDDKFQEFLAKHKDKSPEELARLAFQQQQGRNRAAYDSRQANERLQQTLDRIRQAKEARATDLQRRRDNFGKKLETDPDAATREAYEASLTREQQEMDAQAQREEFEARAAAAVELASAAIPNFQERAPQIRDFGIEMGFSPEEVGQIVDGRQIVTLHLAAIAGNMIKSGLIDASGQFLQLPEPMKGNGDGRPKDTAQRRTQFSRQPARGAGRQPSLAQRAEDIANLSDADFDALDDKELDALLQEIDGAN